jgi:hypothetical protein
MSGLTPAPTKRVHDPSRVATHGVALWSAGDSPFRSARIVMALLVARLAARPGRIRRTCCLTPRAPCSRCSTSEGGAAFALWAAYASAPTSPPPAAQSRKPMGGVPTRASIGAVRAWRYTVGNGQAGGKS